MTHCKKTLFGFTFGRLQTQSPNQRLIFIDVARTIAILLMLEGHFIAATLDLQAIDTEHWLYVSWARVRTITAPLFLMVSGIIFMYLLNRQPELPITSNPRIKKGLKRSTHLFLLGTMLHMSLFKLGDYVRGEFDAWLFSFHILQCIAIGLLIMVVIYHLFKWIGGKLTWYYFISATLILALHPLVLSIEGYFPNDVHPIIQNAIKGPRSIFPIIPWLAFVLYGAAIGAYLSEHPLKSKTNRFPIVLILSGLLLNFGLNHLLFAIDELFQTNVLTISHLLGKMGWVLIILGLLILILQRFQLTTKSLWVRVGQQTLSIYILHCVILYGAITSFGLDSIIGHALTPLQSVIGAVLFMAFFVLVALIAEKVQNLKKRKTKSILDH